MKAERTRATKPVLSIASTRDDRAKSLGNGMPIDVAIPKGFTLEGFSEKEIPVYHRQREFYTKYERPLERMNGWFPGVVPRG